MKWLFRLLLLSFGPPLVCVGSFVVLFVTFIWLTIPQLPVWAQGPVVAWVFGEEQEVGGTSGSGDTAPAGVGVGWSGYIDPDNPNPPSGLPLTGTVYLGCLFMDPLYPKHTGVDFPATLGTPVYTTMAGLVVWSGWNGPWGNLVVVENNGYQVWFAHLMDIGVYVGQVVDFGDFVGTTGSTGNSTGPHLHYGIKQLTETGQVWVNPVLYFDGADFVKVPCSD